MRKEKRAETTAFNDVKGNSVVLSFDIARVGKAGNSVVKARPSE